MKANKNLLDEVKENGLCEYLENKVNDIHAATLYNISKLFKLSSLSKLLLCSIERCFQMVAESKNFLELDISCIRKILSSSELSIDSELQVFNAADDWLCHGITERSKHAKCLLLSVRISLLSDPALSHIINKTSCFTKSEECVNIMKEVLVNKTKDTRIHSSITRYCKQNNFNILVCGGENSGRMKTVSNAYIINGNDLHNVNTLPQMRKGRKLFEIVCIKGEVYVFGGLDNNENCEMSIEKYSPATNAWNKVGYMYDLKYFCGCAFMGNVYVIGGYRRTDGTVFDSCFEFNPKDLTWKEVKRMHEARCNADCAVFEGTVVVTGGCNNDNGFLNTVECYDHVADSWSRMPNMIEKREYHKSAAIKNKLFVVGGRWTATCEVFDSTCSKFVLLKPPSVLHKIFLYIPAKVVTIGSNVVVFCDKGTVLFYDSKTFQWSGEWCEETKGIQNFSCAKVPLF